MNPLAELLRGKRIGKTRGFRRIARIAVFAPARHPDARAVTPLPRHAERAFRRVVGESKACAHVDEPPVPESPPHPRT